MIDLKNTISLHVSFRTARILHIALGMTLHNFDDDERAEALQLQNIIAAELRDAKYES